ncbi:MAG: hypothetical protein ACOX5G_00630 [Kiritimatiellia bacterium]|jgi:hypothetical protein
MPTPSLMPLDRIPDWDRRLARQDAFWDHAVLDRPMVSMSAPKKSGLVPWPAPKAWPSLRDRWFDAGYCAECAVARTLNTNFWGDALPCAWPNLGPEVISAFLGSELEYGESTAWSIPMPDDWDEVFARVRFDEANPYWQAVRTMTDALLERGRGLYYVGITDCHPGGDAIAAFRDPMQLNIDLLESPDEVKRLLRRTASLYLDLFERMWTYLQAHRQACCTWCGIVGSRKWYVPSNDFSCMISKEMFDEFFLPGIAEECRFYGRSVYHLDGPGALRHLPSLLSIPELNAIQWVPGEGHGPLTDWIPVYKQCQAAGKGIQLFNIGLDELETVFSELRPEGVWLAVGGVEDEETAQAVIRRVSTWK